MGQIANRQSLVFSERGMVPSKKLRNARANVRLNFRHSKSFWFLQEDVNGEKLTVENRDRKKGSLRKGSFRWRNL